MNRPDCFEFAMDFLGDPEARIIREYIEQLERQVEELSRPKVEILSRST